MGSIQFYFAAPNLAFITAKGLPLLAPMQTACLAAALVAGLGLGYLLAGLVSV